MGSRSDLPALIDAAKKRGADELESEPHAVEAHFDRTRGLVLITLRNGTLFGVPPRLLQGLGSATPAQLAVIEVSPQGALLTWPKLDVTHGVANLVAGVFGAKWWARERAANAGRVKSEAKAAAARANGAKGGRPRKTAPA